MDQHWNDLVHQFCGVSDRLGMPIDDEIFETVIALNALGITTTASCAGHITRDHGDIRYPWVDVSTSDATINDLQQQHQQLREKAEKQQRKLAHLRKQSDKKQRVALLQQKSQSTWQAYHSVGRTLRKLQVPMRRKLVAYLIQFYHERCVPFDRRLTLQVIASHTRLTSQGAEDFYLAEPRDVQLQKLTEYRDEMHAFTTFLKTIYLSEQTDTHTV